jgi:hypothetical protein
MTTGSGRPDYRRLDVTRVIETARRLKRRIDERFPGSGLGEVAGELLLVAEESVARSAWIAKPIHWLRAGTVVLVLGLLSVIAAVFGLLDLRLTFAQSLADALQGLDAGVNVLVFLSIAIFFLGSIEARIKRARALQALYELRSIAHIIDMHQLTKDPERAMIGASDRTASSPQRNLTPRELARYLDYCSEMLAIVSKIAAIYSERFRDAVALAAVDDVEDLVDGLSRKVWQKIMIVLNSAHASPGMRPD